jgi:hypothetical protein
LPTSQFERIELGKQPLDTLPYMIPFGAQGAHFLF